MKSKPTPRPWTPKEIDKIENLVGFGKGAWDMVPIEDIAGAFRQHFKVDRLHERIAELEQENERLRVLGPDTQERIICESRELAANFMQPALKAWKDRVATLEAEKAEMLDMLKQCDDIVDKLIKDEGRKGFGMWPLRNLISRMSE